MREEWANGGGVIWGVLIIHRAISTVAKFRSVKYPSCIIKRCCCCVIRSTDCRPWPPPHRPTNQKVLGRGIAGRSSTTLLSINSTLIENSRFNQPLNTRPIRGRRPRFFLLLRPSSSWFSCGYPPANRHQHQNQILKHTRNACITC